jgi:prepilin-type N-terminal cleavage/methylation domain-containing protein/prepilin-type processing-associated H-X9-DG protein
MSRRQAFTLVELLVVIGIIAVLVAVLLPTLGKARRQANRAFCLNNIRNMQIAQIQYANDNGGRLVRAGLAHGSAAANEEIAWINTLRRYVGNPSADSKTNPAIVARCPSDDSPHWIGGVPAPGSHPPQFRRTSYGINPFLDEDLCPWGPGQIAFPRPPGGWYSKITKIRRPSVTIQFVEMPYTGLLAASDHFHVENIAGGNPPAAAAKQLQINAHGGPAQSWQSMANYGFLDGHAETLRFSEVFGDLKKFNRFDPALAK